MELSEGITQTELLPFAPKYRYIDKRYRFTDRGIHGCQPMGYPTSDIGYSEHSNVPRSTASQLTKKTLPDVVLLNIFKYIHPIDLVNGISRVSKRWNALAKAPSLYRFVRVLINKKSTDSESAKKFLERAKNCVRKLCATCEMDAFGDIFPKCMPNVTFLDITSFPDASGCADKLISCFPSAEELILNNIQKFDKHALNTLFSKNAFKRLHRLHFGNYEDEAYKVIQKLCDCERPLQLLSITNTTELGKILQTPIRDTLTEFYLRGYLQDGDYAVIGQLLNLSKLSVFSSLYATDEQLMQLKSLRNLEHLHLDCSGQDCDFTIEGLIRFFELPTENESNHFPYRLKYLCFIECYNFQTDVAKALVKSCPQLVSLNVSENCFLPDEGLTVLIKGLPNLRFLDISRMHEEEGYFNEMDGLQFDVIRNLSDEDVPQLQFLQSHYNKFDQEIFWKLNMKRPNLMITTRSDYFINWDIRDGKPFLNDDFKGDMNHLLNDLNECDGFCCMGMSYEYTAS